MINRVMISGTHKGVGKGTLFIGLISALKLRGLNIQPFKVGLDPTFKDSITGNKLRNLDGWLVNKQDLEYLFVRNSEGKDISIIKGVFGLYDSFPKDTLQGSNAYIAKSLRCPVILVVDGEDTSCNVVVKIRDLMNYDKETDIKGVVFSKVHSIEHFLELKESVERISSIECLGYIPNNIRIDMEQLYFIDEDELNIKLKMLGELIEKTIDINKVLSISSDVEALTTEHNSELNKFETVNIGVPYDKAFNFYYFDNIDYLQDLGANIVYFSPLKDERLPKNLDGIYIGGGFPEKYGEQLERNITLRAEIKSMAEDNLPIYAECGGLMYLTKAINTINDKRYKMVGIFDAEAQMTDRYQGVGYYDALITNPCLLSDIKEHIKVHEFHKSKLININEENYAYTAYDVKLRNVLKSKDRSIGDIRKCGLINNNVLASYMHINFYSNKALAVNFIKKCIEFKLRNRY